MQQFLDRLADALGSPRPWRMPLPLFCLTALGVEAFATVVHTPAPIHRDCIRIGAASYCSDTRRMREELLPTLRCPTVAEGLKQFQEK